MNKWGKTVAVFGLSAMLTTGPSFVTSTAQAAAVTKEIQVVLDDIPLNLGVKPVVKDNFTMVPFRSLAQALGIDVSWDSKTKSVRAKGSVNGANREVVLRLGQKVAEVDGKPVKLTAAPLIVNEQVLIPLGFFGAQFGATVSWNGATSTVKIVSARSQMHLRAFYALKSFAQRSRIASMDSVAFGWARIDEKGELTLEGKDYYWPEAAGDVTPESIVKDADAQGAKPYLMVYSVDGKNELTTMLSDETLRSRSIENIVRIAQENGFGGVLLDFEGLGLNLDAASQQKLLNDYATVIASKLKETGIKLSLAVPPPNGAYKGYDYRTLATVADDLVVMAYDYQPQGPSGHTPEPNAKVEEAVQMLLKAGVAKSKLLLGISLWSETTNSVDDKLGIAKRYGLKGAAFWRLTFYGDDFANAIDKTATRIGSSN
ncbi:copper amine oxidase [Cohnella endophytica]|uniref:Copper amine oxidase n=1 Tax=Cohnella endophytica TaxID=2419778 RepID=A0A494Y239_9BACL|nr:stalk domain-containing protein [Cohnella endophytica]RKP56827.1 copper amine oxidase [Cohnella endophytica]